MLLGVRLPVDLSNAGNLGLAVYGLDNAPILLSSVGNMGHVVRGLDNAHLSNAANVEDAVIVFLHKIVAGSLDRRNGLVGLVRSGNAEHGPINAMVIGASRMVLLAIHVASAVVMVW